MELADGDGAQTNPARALGLEDLQEGHLRALLLAVGWLAAWAATRALFWASSSDLLYTWPVPACLGGGVILAYLLHRRRLRLATWVFTLALASALTLETLYFPRGLAPYLLAVVTVVASLLLSEREVLVANLLVLAMLVLAVWRLQPAVAWREMQNSLLLAAVTGLVSWLGTRRLYTVLLWAWDSTQRATAATQQARERRAELLRLNKELDTAYQRLERLNHMLVLAHQEAEEARVLKTQFANAVSHELRSPLNLIIGFSEMMVNSPEVYGTWPWPPRLHNHIQQIHESSRHLSQLVEDVLDMGRLDACRLALDKVATPVGEVIAEALQILRSLYEARGLSLESQVPADLPPVALDRTRIRQVLLNLLTNALRFTERGGVTVCASCNEDDVTISVSDTGVGIASQDLPRLFQEFRQLDGAFYRWQRGSGLGLAISKQLVELHGGRIWAESLPGRGSTFSLSLPIVSQPPSERLSRSAADGHFWDELERKARVRKPILACASDPTLHRLLSTQLAPYDVTWVPQEAKLLQEVAEVHPWAVVLASDQTDAGPRPPVSLLRELAWVPFITCHLPGVAVGQDLGTLRDYLVKPISRDRLGATLSRLDRAIRNLLVVDDEAAMRDFLATALSTLYAECQVWQAENAEQALRLVSEINLDAVLLDLNLPDMDGLDLAAQIHVVTEGRVPVIAVTARDQPAEAVAPEPDLICCTRLVHFSQQEIGKLLNATLEALAPSAMALSTPLPVPWPTADVAPASSETEQLPRPTRGQPHPAPNRQ